MPRKNPRAKGFGPISEELCRETIERAPDAILFLDTKGKIVYCNTATSRMTGFSKKELVGRKFQELGGLRLLDIPRYMIMFQSLKSGNDVNPFGIEWKNKRGEIVYAEVHMGTIKEKGEVKGIQAIVRDQTDRRYDGEVIEESEERYKTMIEESAYAMMIIDKYGELVFSNKATDTLTGRLYIDDTRKDVLRLGIIAKEDIPKVKRAIGEILSGKKINLFEIKMVKADNTDIFVEAHGVRIDYMGEPAVLATLRDITAKKKVEDALKESEAKYRSLVENATDQIFMLDKECRFLSMNRAVANFHRKPANELMGKSISQLFPKEVAALLTKNLGGVFKTGKSVHLEEQVKIRGRNFYFSTSLNPVKNEKGEMIAVMGIVRDITEKKIGK